ncbi:hypothetical protein [Polaribacter batillariae]|uniref:hypothetical protein n=1 Tax=Polaribacter batillariae TaxID=2808900 RepID=UPI001FB10D6A|nr:hypothetical protein [Polaribacter batillariae]
MIRKIIYTLGQRFRNPSLKKQYLFLKASEKWSLKELEKYQLKQLQKLLHDANLYSAYYQNKFKKNNLDISEIKTLEDIQKIPILEKKEILNNIEGIHTNIKFRKVFWQILLVLLVSL